MEAMRSWFQQIKQHWMSILVFAILLGVAIALIITVVWLYGTGFNGYNQVTTARTISGPSAGTVVRTEVTQPGKPLWDWLQLLIIPFALAVIALVFQLANTRTERQIAKQRYEQDQQIAKQRYEQDQQIALDKQREDLLQTYINGMSELLLEKDLRTSDVDAEVRTIARTRTLTVLPRLDCKRKRNLLLFLFDAGLINREHQVIDISDADLSEADLGGIILSRSKWIIDRSSNEKKFKTVTANLSGVDLRNANLNWAILNGAKLGAENEIELRMEIESTNSTNGAILCDAKLVHANLCKADLGGADLSRADLSHANLGGAYLFLADLREANLHEADLSIEFLREEIGDSLAPDEDRPDTSRLIGADLSHADLRGANLTDTNLWQANLSCANLQGVNLRGANLTGANLFEANLTGADLFEANLTSTNLYKADLTNTMVTPEQLSQAKMRRRWYDGSIYS